jgi:hypothetical protein
MRERDTQCVDVSVFSVCKVAKSPCCVQRFEFEAGDRCGVTTVEALRLKTPERENKELRRANYVLTLAVHFSPRRSSPADSSPEGVRGYPLWRIRSEPFCGALPIAPPGYRRFAARQRDPDRCRHR